MKKILLTLFIGLSVQTFAQQNIRVPLNMLLQIKIPIQPDDKNLNDWNVVPSLQDSGQIVRTDRAFRGFAPFIPVNDAPYYSASSISEIKISLEKLLNPDLYFKSNEEFMRFSSNFLDKFVFRNTGK